MPASFVTSEKYFYYIETLTLNHTLKAINQPGDVSGSSRIF